MRKRKWERVKGRREHLMERDKEVRAGGKVEGTIKGRGEERKGERGEGTSNHLI